MEQQQERIAKVIARAGICSRRDAESLISEGRVKLNGAVVETFGTKVTDDDDIAVDGQLIDKKDDTRVWIYHKPKGLITSHKDKEGRQTVFETLPKYLPRVISVGRLDYNSEGLLLLTNDGELSRFMEMPKNKMERTYRARVFGDINKLKVKEIEHGITIDKIKYQPASIELESSKGDNSWFILSLTEGKNREIRKIFEHYGLTVNRLIRISYGSFELGDLQPGEVREIPSHKIKEKIKI